MKEVYRSEDIAAYSVFKDYFGNNIYVVTHDTLEEIRLYSKNKEYRKERKWLDTHGNRNVYTPEWGEVIDISESTLAKIKENFPNMKLPMYKWQVWK